jgi:hypothetical protein
MWLRDSLPYDLPDARVFLYGYDTNLLQSQTFQDIDDLGLRLSESLRSIKRSQKVCCIRSPAINVLIQIGQDTKTIGLYRAQPWGPYSERGS